MSNCEWNVSKYGIVQFFRYDQSGGLWTHRGYFRSVSLYCVCNSCGSCSGRSTGSSDGKICDCISCSDRMSRIQGADKQSQHSPVIQDDCQHSTETQQFQKHMLKMHQVRLCQMIKMMFEHTSYHLPPEH